MENMERYKQLPVRLLPWYRQNARELPWRKDKDPYHVWLSEIMLQQTRVEAVKGYYTRFLEKIPSIRDLAEAEEGVLLKLWEGLGYYSRVRNLKKAAQMIISEYSGVFPQDEKSIALLPGIGPYTTGAIASICFELPVPAVDGNVLRVLARITKEQRSIDVPAVKKEMTMHLAAAYPAEACGDFTQSIMELGATICVPNGMPLCLLCPLNDLCLAFQEGVTDQLPVRTEKKKRKIEAHTVFVFHCKGKIAIESRKDKGLLAGLWQLPNVLGEKTGQEALDIAKSFGIVPTVIHKSVERVHIFTHKEWHMICYYISCNVPAERFIWADKQVLRDEIALPTAFKMFLESETLSDIMKV